VKFKMLGKVSTMLVNPLWRSCACKRLDRGLTLVLVFNLFSLTNQIAIFFEKLNFSFMKTANIPVYGNIWTED